MKTGRADITTDLTHHTVFDGLGRVLTTTFLDGEQESRTYACCGVETLTDRDGVTTTFGYDAAGRRISSTRLGITQMEDYDAAGRVWRQRRIGTNSTEIVLQILTHNTRGDVVSRHLAGQATPSFQYRGMHNGTMTRTNIAPDGGRQIEEYDRSGALTRLTGAASRPVRLDWGVDSTKGAWKGQWGRSRIIDN